MNIQSLLQQLDSFGLIDQSDMNVFGEIKTSQELVEKLDGMVDPEELAECLGRSLNLPILREDDLASDIKIEVNRDGEKPWIFYGSIVYLTNPFDRSILQNVKGRRLPYTGIGIVSSTLFSSNEFLRLINKGEDLSASKGQVGSSWARDLVQRLINEAYSQGVSDIHLMPEMDGTLSVCMRKDGDVKPTAQYPLAQHETVARTILQNLCGVTYEKKRPQDGRFASTLSNTDEIEIRVAAIPTKVKGERYSKMTLRLLNNGLGVPSLEAAGILESDIEKLTEVIQRPQGIFIVSGPTGSGKSTTLILLMKRLKKLMPDKKIYTIEEPVEQEVAGFSQVEIDVNFTFADALRNILRQDPDVILVGEIRDKETAGLAIQAANTGHFVFSTTHTNNAHLSITRFKDLGFTAFDISQALVGVTAQRLVKRLCPHCRIEVPSDDKSVKGLFDVNFYNELTGKETVWKENPTGCKKCDSGFKGRVTIMEYLENTKEMEAKIISGQAPTAIRANQIHSNTFDDMWVDGLRHVAVGDTSISQLFEKLGPYWVEHERTSGSIATVSAVSNTSLS